MGVGGIVGRVVAVDGGLAVGADVAVGIVVAAAATVGGAAGGATVAAWMVAGGAVVSVPVVALPHALSSRQNSTVRM